jgi:iron complex outermembrane receptor protein
MSRVKTLAPFGPVPAQSPNSDGIYFSPTTGIVYAHNDNVSAFLRTGLGIKPHGYSAFSDNPATASFGEERNWSNEAGVQYNDPDSNLNVVVRAFWNVIDDYQLNAQNPFSTDFVIVNADEVRSRGLEAELQWRPIDPLLIHGNAGWTDVEFESYTDPFTGMNHDGSNVPFIPELTASAGFRYDLPGGFFFGSSVRATEDTYYDAANTGAFLQDGYWIWDAQAGYEAENWSVTVYGRNILDEEYYTFINPQIAAGSPGDPQLFGVQVNLDLW